MSETIANQELPRLKEMTKQTGKASTTADLGTTLWGDFIHSTTNANPGWNYVIVDGLPVGTRFVSAWVTEWAGGVSHASSASFNTASVQLFNNGTQCRIVYRLDWGSSLPVAVQMIYG